MEQGNTNWCFGASLGMVLGYYGKEATMTDIATSLGETKDNGINILEMFLGPVDSYLSRWPGILNRHHLGGWDFTQYVDAINSGIPIVVSTFGFPGHTLVVVGYAKEAEDQYLYIHDPSGYFSRLRWGNSRVRYAKVEWSLFSKNYWTQLVLCPANPNFTTDIR